MTPEQRRTIRAELARRMGWTDIEPCKDWDFTFSPSGLPPGQKEYTNIPDPFTNAEDKDALVTWLAADDDRYSVFDTELRIELHRRGLITDAPTLTAVELRRKMMTASYEVVTLAAARALGIQEAGE